MAKLGLAFQLSASAVGMSQGINAGVVELQKLGYAAKQTARDVSTLKTLEISRAFISGVSSIASAFSSFTSGALSSVDATRQLAQNLGVSYAELRNLQIAADLSGASSEQLAKAFTRAQITITNASRGSKEAKSALASLGLSVDTLAKQGSTQQFASIATAINSIENPAQRAAAAVAVFGRSGAELLPTFRELPENLRTAQQFLEGFKGGLKDADATKIDAIGDSFSLAGQAIKELAGRILVELSPALTQGAGKFVEFVQSIDIPAAARGVESLLQDIATAMSAVATVAAPLATNLLPAIGGYLAFINRQAIAGGIAALSKYFFAASAAALGYATSAGVAATATAALAASVRGLLAATGVGLLAVVLGAAAGALVDWAVSGKQAGDDTQAAVAAASQEVKKFTAEAQGAGRAAIAFGDEVKRALKAPGEVSFKTFAQDALDEARSSVVSLAKELGGIDKVPAELLDRFNRLRFIIETSADDTKNFNEQMRLTVVSGKNIVNEVQQIIDLRKQEADATREVAEAAKRAAEESRKRVQDLAEQSLTGGERDRLQLAKDLAAIAAEQRNAEQAREEAIGRFDFEAMRAANERLSLLQQATEEAKKQSRDRQLQNLGVDANLLQPVRTVADEFQSLRDAFNQRLIDPQQFRTALERLSAEGIQIRNDLAADLARPAQRALEVQDIRTQGGMSEFMALATGREDPAVEQRREQLRKLDEINRGLRAIGLQPADILG